MFDSLQPTHAYRKNAVRDGGIETFTGPTGKRYLHIKAANGQTVGASQGYASDSGLRNGMGPVRKNASDAKVVDTTA